MSLSPMIRVVRLAIGIAVRRPVAEVMPTRTILAPDPRHRHRTCAMPPARKPGLAGSLGAAGRGSGVSCRKGRPAYCSACFGASRWRGQAWAAPGMPSRRLGRPAHTRCRQGPGHGRMDRGSAAACLPARTAQAVAIGRRTPPYMGPCAVRQAWEADPETRTEQGPSTILPPIAAPGMSDPLVPALTAGSLARLPPFLAQA